LEEAGLSLKQTFSIKCRTVQQVATNFILKLTANLSTGSNLLWYKTPRVIHDDRSIECFGNSEIKEILVEESYHWIH